MLRIMRIRLAFSASSKHFYTFMHCWHRWPLRCCPLISSRNHSHLHSHLWRCLQGQLRAPYLAQGHLDTEVGDRTSDPLIRGWPYLLSHSCANTAPSLKCIVCIMCTIVHAPIMYDMLLLYQFPLAVICQGLSQVKPCNYALSSLLTYILISFMLAQIRLWHVQQMLLLECITPARSVKCCANTQRHISAGN